MGYTRGASALGVAVALDEVEESKVTEETILKRLVFIFKSGFNFCRSRVNEL